MTYDDYVAMQGSISESKENSYRIPDPKSQLL
jgi:hypothetical protein